MFCVKYLSNELQIMLKLCVRFLFSSSSSSSPFTTTWCLLFSILLFYRFVKVKYYHLVVCRRTSGYVQSKKIFFLFFLHQMNHLFYLTTWCAGEHCENMGTPSSDGFILYYLDKAENKRYHVNYIFPLIHIVWYVFMLIEG